MRLKIYDPFPRTPETAQRVNVCANTREARVIGVIAMPTRKVRRFKSGKRRITY